MNKIIKLLMATVYCIMLTGCNIANPDSNAVWLKLNFAKPELFPFLETDLYNINRDKSRISCFIWDCEKKQWSPTQGYDIDYVWEGYPKKIEEYLNNEVYCCDAFVIFPLRNKKNIKLKLIASSTDNSFEPRYCIISVDDLTKLKKEQYRDIGYFLIFHYALSFIKINVNIPPWNKWTNIIKVNEN